MKHRQWPTAINDELADIFSVRPAGQTRSYEPLIGLVLASPDLGAITAAHIHLGSCGQASGSAW